MQKVCIGVLLLLCNVALFAQGEIDSSRVLYYLDEQTIAAQLTTNGYGLSYRFATHSPLYFRKRTVEADIAALFSPKETKISSGLENNKKYVFGKLNDVLVLRFGLGRQYEIFSKNDKGGISMRYFWSGGINTAVLKPIYYEVDYSPEPPKVEKFNRNKPQLLIYGEASLTKGLNELQFIPGLYLKVGTTFEYGKSEFFFNAIETGILLDAFVQPVAIMATKTNDYIFASFFASYRFGRIIRNLH